MSDVKKCDRCGEIYEQLSGYKIRMQKLTSNYWGDPRDLCPKCKEELDCWMRGTAVEPKEETDESKRIDINNTCQ